MEILRCCPRGRRSYHELKSDEAALLEEIERSREPFMNHFRRTYGTDHPAPPVWCAIEVIPFGSLVTLYRNTTRKVKKAVSDVFGVPSEVLESWILALNTVRNLCAHQSAQRVLRRELRFMIRGCCWRARIGGLCATSTQVRASRWCLPARIQGVGPPLMPLTICTSGADMP